MLTLTRFAACLCWCIEALLVLSGIGSAKTLKLTGVEDTSAAGVYTEVYALTDSEKAILTFCDDVHTRTYVGEGWNASSDTLRELGKPTFNQENDPDALSKESVKDYEAAIHLDQLLAETQGSEPQRIDGLSSAIWGIFSEDARKSRGYDAAALGFDKEAWAMKYDFSEYSNRVIVTANPVNSSQEPFSANRPRTPEPSALLLFGSGLVGLSRFAKRFRRSARIEEASGETSSLNVIAEP
jgi:PEP-CTERM motif